MVTLLGLLTISAYAVDLGQRYPTRLTAGDATVEHAREWNFKDTDIFRLSQFTFEIGSSLRIAMGPADLGIGHGEDGAFWAVVLPRQGGTITSSAASQPEPISRVWLRFHPAEIDNLFPPATVFDDGPRSLMREMQTIANAKFRSSWHAGQKALIPEPKDFTVDVDTKGGPRRFFVVDRSTGTAKYVDAFAQRATGANTTVITLKTAPPVVIKTVPEAGATEVDPGLTELRVTFSKPMKDGSWSWSTWGEQNFPEINGKIHYLADGRTCVLPVKLQPGKFYATWLNSEKFTNFKDGDGRAAVPYLLTFRTRD
jgi:RNA polymerase sigma-70 factor (ECF subfamily)